MPAVSEAIPLLPLPAVLFPGTFLPVQITEAPHRALLRSCADDGHQLGIFLTPYDAATGRPAAPCATGCLASIALLLSEDDAEKPLSAVLYGEQRIRVVEFVQQAPYPVGHVEVLDDYPGSNAQRRTQQAATLFHRYLELIRTRYQTEITNLPLPDDPTMASYLLASVLSLPLEVKQRWLESASAALRLEEEVAFLGEECERLETLLILSKYTSHHYTYPDPAHYTPLILPN